MSVVGHAPPPFFKRGPAPLVRLAFFASLSILLLIADLRLHTLEWARLVVATAAWPLQRAAWLPLDVAENLSAYLARVSTLQKENEAMHRHQLEAAHLLLRQHHLEEENHRLRTLLDLRAHQPVSGQIAEIIYAARDPFSRRVILDKGTQHGLQPGQAVIDEMGVIGQVTRVFPLTAEVTLITDKQQMTPVQVQRTGLRAILAGAGDNLELRFLATNADIQPGDLLVTSGLDDIYLPGLPVATITHIDRNTSYTFARIIGAPRAALDRHSLVLVLAPRTGRPPRPEEEAAPATVAEQGKRIRRGTR